MAFYTACLAKTQHNIRRHPYKTELLKTIFLYVSEAQVMSKFSGFLRMAELFTENDRLN
jgi:hypothetical protein